MSHFEFQHSPEPKWTLQMNKGSNFHIYLTTAPNHFHRWMQGWMLGFQWTRLEEKQK